MILVYVIVGILALVLLVMGLLSLRFFQDTKRANQRWIELTPPN